MQEEGLGVATASRGGRNENTDALSSTASVFVTPTLAPSCLKGI